VAQPKESREPIRPFLQHSVTSIRYTPPDDPQVSHIDGDVMKKTSKSDSVPGNRKTAGSIVPPPDDALFGRVASILEQARVNVVRAVNHNMVVAYWLIGREIVMELQRGQERAGYGNRVVQDLSIRLTAVFGKGYSVENLWKFKMFYLAYAFGPGILSTSWTESAAVSPESALQSAKLWFPEFSDRLTWSHYRALMRVEATDARDYYEKEAAFGNWTVRELERQIHTNSYERLLVTQMRRRGKSKPDEPPFDVTPDAGGIPAPAPVPDPVPPPGPSCPIPLIP